jgi:hypothetical protein
MNDYRSDRLTLMKAAPLVVGILAIAAALSGCASQGYSVIASTATTLGVSIAQQPANGAPDAVLGYKRAEFAFVPTNRNSGTDAGKNGDGAKDSANVIMELRYSGTSNSGIYQRLAVGNIAVAQNSANILFAKAEDGTLNAEAANALKSIRGIPAEDLTSNAAKALLSKKYHSYVSTSATDNVAKFNAAAILNGYSNGFGSFASEQNTPLDKVKAVQTSLEAAGFTFN